MIARKRRHASPIAIGSLLLIGSYVGCYPDFDGLSSGEGDDDGKSGASTGGASSGSSGAGGAIGGNIGAGGEAGESAGRGGTQGGSSTGGNDTGGTSMGGKGGSSGGKGGSTTGGEGGDAGTGDTGGSAGMAGKGGSGGAGGTPMGGAGAGGMGGAGAGGQPPSCMEPMGVTATGVMMMSVPLMAIGHGQRYNTQNRTSPSMPYDLSGQTVTFRAYAPCAIGGNLSIFFRSGTPAIVDSPATKVALSTLTAGFVDVPITVPGPTAGFDPTIVDVIRIEVEADAAYGSTFQSPATIVYLDSVTSSNALVMQTYDSQPTVQDFGDSGVRPLMGSSFRWLLVYP